MPSGFRNFHYHAERPDEGSGLESLRPRSLATLEAAGPIVEDSGAMGFTPGFENDEAAARYYLGQMFATQSGLESLAAVSSPEAVPDLRTTAVQDQSLTNTRLVHFQQEKDKIPIFGSNLVVELDAQRNCISADADVADIQGVSAIAKLSPAQALRRIARYTGAKPKALSSVSAPEITFFHDEKNDSWHLAYFYQKVPAAPPDFQEEVAEEEWVGFGHGGVSPRTEHPEFNYLVDAHDGSILFEYSAHPLLDVPSKCQGMGEDGQQHMFWGRQLASAFALDDPLRTIKTFDLQFGDIERTNLPQLPVANATSDWLATHPAAVSAHVNAMRVYDFFKAELKRDGIDDKGMELISVVNCTYPRRQPPPQWSNAAWWNNRMWYGQVKDSNGKLRSYSRYLDIIAHELSHGVTESTAGLVYKDQQGALNESFSDIFGVIIRNWYESGPDTDVSAWNWEIGSGLGAPGQPLRDMKDPARLKFSAQLLGPNRTGKVAYPAHMDDYIVTTADSGGVHINSNIHNKAAYNVLTIADDDGNRIFTPREVAILYYLTLTRLGKLADFQKTLQVLVDVTSTFYAGNKAEMDQKIKAIKTAYDAVGIQMPA